MLKNMLSVLILSISSSVLFAQELVSIADFGLQPNTRENAIPYVKKMLESCIGKKDVTLYFPEGRYDFYPQYQDTAIYYESNSYDVMPKYLAVLLKNRDGITLDGDGSDFVMHGRIQPITIDNSERVSIKNLSIDWEIPLTAQGEVIATADNYVDIKIADESPFVIENGILYFVGPGFKSALHGMIEFRGSTRYTEPYVADSPLVWSTIKSEVDKDVVRFMAKEGEELRMPPVGNLFVLRHNSRDHAGIFICDSKDITFNDVNVYHTGGLGILCQYTENLTFINTNVTQNTAKGRLLSGHDDGLHFSGCKGDIYVENSHFEGLMDDPINVHGTYARITEVLAPNKVICQWMHSMSVGMVWGQPGDKVGYIENNTMTTVSKGSMKSFNAIDTKKFVIELNENLPQGIGVGAALENLTWVPNFTVKNSYFGPSRARGLLVSTPGKVVIENNTFASSGSAILIAGDANGWYESGACTDVLIKGNTFLYPCNSSIYQFCQAIITIEPEIPNPDNTNSYHRNIRIEENNFNPFDNPILFAKSVDGLTFVNNIITRSYEYKPYHPRKEGIILEECQNVTIKGNEIIGDVLGKYISIENMKNSELSLDRKEFFKLKK